METLLMNRDLTSSSCCWWRGQPKTEAVFKIPESDTDLPLLHKDYLHYIMDIRVFQKNFFLEFCNFLWTIAAKWCINTLSSFTLYLEWGNRPKMRLGHNFSLGGPIDTRSMRLDCILQDLFRDTLLDHIWHSQLRTPNIVFGCICPYLGA